MMSDTIIIGYDLSAIDNHAYFFEDAPKSIFCDKCGSCTDNTYLPKQLKVPNRTDIGYTYDGRPIVSLRFKDYIELLGFDVDFLPVNQKNTLFLMRPQNIIKYSAHQIENYCDKCHQYSDQVLPRPDFYYESGIILNEGIFLTSTVFGSGYAKSPSIILGIESAILIKEAVKNFKFRGADISPIKIKVE